MNPARPAEIVPQEFLESLLSEGNRGIDRDESARILDGFLWRLSRQDALGRRALGCLAARFLDSRGHGRLGFARVGDYASERLGISGRELYGLAQVARKLVELPDLAYAFEAGFLNWTKLRAVAPLATRDTQSDWIGVAVENTSREMATIIKDYHRRGDAEPPALSVLTLEALGTINAVDDPDVVDGEPRMVVRLPCPVRLRSLWRRVRQLARQMAGSDIAHWQALEVVAAEGLSAAPGPGRPETGVGSTERGCVSAPAPGAGSTDRGGASAPGNGATERAISSAGQRLEPVPVAARRCADRDIVDPAGSMTAELEGRDLIELREQLDWIIPDDALPRNVERLCDAGDTLSARELDRRMRQVLEVMRKVDWQMGCLLRVFIDLHLFGAAGYATSGEYLAERLGISARKARSLTRIERAGFRGGAALTDAYRAGTLSLLRALTLLPVISERYAEAWVERANQVTLRRLADEVEWARDMHDRSGARVSIAPPSLGAELDFSDAAVTRQMRAHLAPSVIDSILTRTPELDSAIMFLGPQSIMELFCEAVTAFRQPGEPPWMGLERLLLHVENAWENVPRHRNPIHALDGWRCRVPTCSSRMQLQEHHVIFRSRGGDNEQTNRVSVCVWHHQVGLHQGPIRAWGDARGEIHWQLGVDRDRGPLIELRNDVYVEIRGAVAAARPAASASEVRGEVRGENRGSTVAGAGAAAAAAVAGVAAAAC